MEPIDELITEDVMSRDSSPGILSQLQNPTRNYTYQMLTYERLTRAIEEIQQITNRRTILDYEIADAPYIQMNTSTPDFYINGRAGNYGYEDYGFYDLYTRPTPRRERVQTEYERWRECQKLGTRYIPKRIINEEDDK